MRVLASLLVLAALVAPAPLLARWEGPQDNRSVTALEGMSLDQLFNDALDVCVGRALLEGPSHSASPAASAASAYLETIARVVTRKSGGMPPLWMHELLSARTGKECQHGMHSFLGGDGQREAGKAHARRRSRPRVRRNQLPPWLAPH